MLVVGDLPIVDGGPAPSEVGIGGFGDGGFGGGADGDFGGGGVSAGWDDVPPPSIAPSPQPAAVAPASPQASGDRDASVGDLLDLDDGWIVVVPIALAAISLFAAIYINPWVARSSSPKSRSHAALASGLYRRLYEHRTPMVVSSAVRKTRHLAVVVIVFLDHRRGHHAVGRADGRTIGEVLRQAG